MSYTLSSLEKDKKILLITSEKEDSSSVFLSSKAGFFYMTTNMVLILARVQVSLLYIHDRLSTDFNTAQFIRFLKIFWKWTSPGCLAQLVRQPTEHQPNTPRSSVNLRSGHIEDSTNGYINKWNNKSMFLSLFLSLSNP